MGRRVTGSGFHHALEKSGCICNMQSRSELFPEENQLSAKCRCPPPGPVPSLTAQSISLALAALNI